MTVTRELSMKILHLPTTGGFIQTTSYRRYTIFNRELRVICRFWIVEPLKSRRRFAGSVLLEREPATYDQPLAADPPQPDLATTLAYLKI